MEAGAAKSRPGVRLNEDLEHPDGAVVFQHACKMGLESIVSKRLGSRIDRAGRPTGSSLRTPRRPRLRQIRDTQSALRSPAFQLIIPKAERRASSAGSFFSSATFIASRTMPLKSST